MVLFCETCKQKMELFTVKIGEISNLVAWKNIIHCCPQKQKGGHDWTRCSVASSLLFFYGVRPIITVKRQYM